MTTLEWLQGRLQPATAGAKRPGTLDGGVAGARQSPEKAPRSPEESLFDFVGEKFFSPGVQAERKYSGHSRERDGALGASREDSGQAPAADGPEILPIRVVSEDGAAGSGQLPYLTPGGTLVIPFDSPERYHWWKLDGNRLSVAETRAEALGRMEEEKRKGDDATTI